MVKRIVKLHGQRVLRRYKESTAVNFNIKINVVVAVAK